MTAVVAGVAVLAVVRLDVVVMVNLTHRPPRHVVVMMFHHARTVDVMMMVVVVVVAQHVADDRTGDGTDDEDADPVVMRLRLRCEREAGECRDDDECLAHPLPPFPSCVARQACRGRRRGRVTICKKHYSGVNETRTMRAFRGRA